MNMQNNFGLSHQEPRKEDYDQFSLGKNWDLGFISKKGIKLRQEQKKAETDSLKARTAIVQKILSEPTNSESQDQDSGMSIGKAILISSLVILAGLSFAKLMKRKSKPVSPKNSLEAGQIV